MAASQTSYLDQWSNLPPELLQLILNRLHSILDRIKFGAVCKPWQSTLYERSIFETPCSPMLLVPTGDNGNAAPRGLLDPATSRLYNIPPLPESHHKIIVGSSFGWLVMYSITNYEMELFNPITRAHIPLPPATEFDDFPKLIDPPDGAVPCYSFPVEFFISKAFLFSDPIPSSIVMVFHGPPNQLGFCRVGDKTWTSLPVSTLKSQYQDLIYHKGKYYAVTQSGIVVVCELDHVPKVVEVARLSKIVLQRYLVESSDKMLVVGRCFKVDKRTDNFVIHHLNIEAKKFEEVRSLDDQIVFLGKSLSMSVSGNVMRECQPNSIYFVEDDYDVFDEGCFDMGIYNLEDGKISGFYTPPEYLTWPMFWITPSIYKNINV